MAEYIEREALINRLLKVSVTDNIFGMGVQFGTDHVIQVINEAPAADVAPVRHGRWTWKEEGEIDWEQFYRCSNCGDKEYWESNFCPNCGADMRGSNDE